MGTVINEQLVQFLAGKSHQQTLACVYKSYHSAFRNLLASQHDQSIGLNALSRADIISTSNFLKFLTSLFRLNCCLN
jgi:hypothetical protein